MKIKVSEATNNQLNWMVAACEHKALRHKYGSPTFDPKTKRVYETEGLRQIGVNFAPTTDWSQGGPIIEREGVGIWPPDDTHPYWSAGKEGLTQATFGPTPLIAGLRCVVMSELGEVVEVPDDLA